MRRFFILAAALALISTPALADRYSFDKEHTNIIFHVNHLGFSDMVGVVTGYDGAFEFDETKPEASKVDVTLKPTSIRTSSEALDKHLQSKDFFNSEQFPDIRFVSKAIKVTGKNTGDISGELTLLGVTKPVTLHVTFNKADYHPSTKMFVAGFTAETVIKRSDFGMAYGIPLVSDEVRIDIQTEGVNQDRKKAEELKK